MEISTKSGFGSSGRGTQERSSPVDENPNASPDDAVVLPRTRKATDGEESECTTYKWKPSSFWSTSRYGTQTWIYQSLLRKEQAEEDELVLSRSTVVGQAGGSIALRSFKVTVPPCAVDQDVKLSVANRSPPKPIPLENHPDVALAGFVSCTPSGMKFKRDVWIETKVSLPDAEMHKIRIVYIPQGHGSSGKTEPEDYRDITHSCGLTIGGGTVKFKVDHFTDYVILVPLSIAIAGTIAGTLAGTAFGVFMRDLVHPVQVVRSTTMMVKAYVTFDRSGGSFVVAFGADEDEFVDYGHFPL
eukprot:scpid96288/ scgid13271/ 